jgi:hypothetical protein
MLLVVVGRSAAAATCDFPRTVECRDVTPDEFDESRPGERLIELALRVSVRFHGNEANQVDEITIDIADTPASLNVHRFSPETKLSSELAGDIHRTTTVESTNSLGATLGGELPVVAGDVIAHVTPSISGNLGQRESATERVSRLSPKQTVVVSGTTNAGRGVFFKLRRNSQNTLEGVHELKVTYVAPADWQTGSINVACRAHGRHKLFGVVEQPKVFGTAAAPVHLYLAGNDEARQIAHRRAGQPVRHEVSRFPTPKLRDFFDDPIATKN